MAQTAYAVCRCFPEGHGVIALTHNLVYTIGYRLERVDGVATAFRAQTEGKHGDTVRSSLDILRRRFGDELGSAGYTKDGPIANESWA